METGKAGHLKGRPDEGIGPYAKNEYKNEYNQGKEENEKRASNDCGNTGLCPTGLHPNARLLQGGDGARVFPLTWVSFMYYSFC